MKTNKFFFFLLIMCGFFILSKNLYGVTDSLLAGTSKVNITPPVKEPLHDSLFARCLVLDLNGTRLAFISVNNDIVIATCPGEPFIQLQIELKKNIREASGNPFLFGYTWYEGTWPNYIPDIKSAALGGYGADQNSPVAPEIGSGEIIMNRHFENYLKLNGLMREKPGPVGFKAGSRWIIKEVPI